MDDDEDNDDDGTAAAAYSARRGGRVLAYTKKKTCAVYALQGDAQVANS